MIDDTLNRAIKVLKKDANWERYNEDFLQPELNKINSFNEPIKIPEQFDSLSAQELMVARAILIENIKFLLGPLLEDDVMTNRSKSKDSYQ